MRKLLLMTTCAVLATSQMLVAVDADSSRAQLDKIKTLRSSVLNKMPALADIFDNEHNGVNAAWTPANAAFYEAIAKLNKQIQEEGAKAADTQDKTAIAAWQAKVARFQALWAERSQKWWPAWSGKFNTLASVRLQLANLVANQANQDQAWLRAECDRGVLISVFAELDKRADELKNQASALVAEAIKQSEDDERVYKE